MSIAADDGLLADVFSVVFVIGFAKIFEQAEAQSVCALMADRQVRKDEVASPLWSFETDHASDRSTGEDGGRAFSWHASRLRLLASLLQRCKQEVVGIDGEGDIVLDVINDFEDLELHDRWRIDWSTVGGSYIHISRCIWRKSEQRLTFCAGAACPGTRRLLDDGQMVRIRFASPRRSRRGIHRLVAHRLDAGTRILHSWNCCRRIVLGVYWCISLQYCQ